MLIDIGTLTENELEFVACVVNGKLYGNFESIDDRKDVISFHTISGNQ